MQSCSNAALPPHLTRHFLKRGPLHRKRSRGGGIGTFRHNPLKAARRNTWGRKPLSYWNGSPTTSRLAMMNVNVARWYQLLCDHLDCPGQFHKWATSYTRSQRPVSSGFKACSSEQWHIKPTRRCWAQGYRKPLSKQSTLTWRNLRTYR